MADQYEVECPMPDCTEALAVTFTGCWTLSPEELTPERSYLPTPEGSHTTTWQIECMAGHVVLLPTEAWGCPVENETDQSCPHADDAHDGEDYRTLRAEDMTRLRDLAQALARADALAPPPDRTEAVR